MNRINEIEKTSPELAKELDMLINTIASYGDIIKNDVSSYEYVKNSIDIFTEELEEELKKFL